MKLKLSDIDNMYQQFIVGTITHQDFTEVLMTTGLAYFITLYQGYLAGTTTHREFTRAYSELRGDEHEVLRLWSQTESRRSPWVRAQSLKALMSQVQYELITQRQHENRLKASLCRPI